LVPILGPGGAAEARPADDGLKANFPKQWVCRTDEGLEAGSPTYFPRRDLSDDGLTTGGYTTSHCPVMGPAQPPAR